MPTLENSEAYSKVYEKCKEIFHDYYPKMESIAENTVLYRYAEYRDSKPQKADALQTIWTPEDQDKTNRWTGAAPTEYGYAPKQGLYFTLDTSGPAEIDFSELRHYIQPTSETAETKFTYYSYEKGRDPQILQTTTKKLDTSFMFLLKKDIKGYDLTMNNDAFFTALFESVRNFLKTASSWKDAYNSPNDASFCRAIGNYILDATNADYFIATSVRSTLNGRDIPDKNIILKPDSTENGHPTVKYLEPCGRISWFFDTKHSEGKAIGVYSAEDLKYNADLFQDSSEKHLKSV